jgi:hypothetical protein
VLAGVPDVSEVAGGGAERTAAHVPPPRRHPGDTASAGEVHLRVRVRQQRGSGGSQLFGAGVLRLVDEQAGDVVEPTPTTRGAGPVLDDGVAHRDRLLTEPVEDLRLALPREIPVRQQGDHPLMSAGHREQFVGGVQDRFAALRQPPQLDNLDLVALAVLAGHLTARGTRRPPT